MAKYWYSYTQGVATAPARNQTSNYVYIKTLPACGNTVKPCAIFATGSAGTTTGSTPLGTTISANLVSYFDNAIGSQSKYPLTGLPFVYLKS